MSFYNLCAGRWKSLWQSAQYHNCGISVRCWRFSQQCNNVYTGGITIIMNKLVFIEGVSGVGKTTLTVKLCEELRRMGFTADYRLEGSDNNPLDPFNGSYPPPIPRALFFETYVLLWQDFIKNRSEDDGILVLDGTLLHHQINDLIRLYSMADEDIVNHISHLLSIIQTLNPVILYLSSNDVGACLRQARKKRNQSAASEEQIAFWTKRKSIDLTVLNSLKVKSHYFDIDDGWDSALKAMTLCLV